jgi:recombination protein RecA
MYGEGISKAGEVLDLAVELEIVKKSGSWFSYETNRLGQGRDAVKDLIKDNPELMDRLEAQIKEKIKGDEDVLLDTVEPNIEEDDVLEE